MYKADLMSSSASPQQLVDIAVVPRQHWTKERRKPLLDIVVSISNGMCGLCSHKVQGTRKVTLTLPITLVPTFVKSFDI